MLIIIRIMGEDQDQYCCCPPLCRTNMDMNKFEIFEEESLDLHLSPSEGEDEEEKSYNNF